MNTIACVQHLSSEKMQSRSKLFFPIGQKLYSHLENSNGSIKEGKINKDTIAYLHTVYPEINYKRELIDVFDNYTAFYFPDNKEVLKLGGNNNNSYGVAFIHKVDGPPHIHHQSDAILRGCDPEENGLVQRYNSNLDNENPNYLRAIKQGDIVHIPAGEIHGHILPYNIKALLPQELQTTYGNIKATMFGFAQGCDHRDNDSCRGDFHTMNIKEIDMYKALVNKIQNEQEQSKK